MRIYEKRESKLGGDANGNMSDKQGQIDTEQNESKLDRKGIKVWKRWRKDKESREK